MLDHLFLISSISYLRKRLRLQPGLPEKPPNKILDNTKSPNACQKFITETCSTVTRILFQSAIMIKPSGMSRANAKNGKRINRGNLERVIVFYFNSFLKLHVNLKAWHASVVLHTAFLRSKCSREHLFHQKFDGREFPQVHSE
jgi:hypothetical protein